MSAPLFKPFRALGYITENVPFAVSRRGKETYVVVSVGKAWQVGERRRLARSQAHRHSLCAGSTQPQARRLIIMFRDICRFTTAASLRWCLWGLRSVRGTRDGLNGFLQLCVRSQRLTAANMR